MTTAKTITTARERAGLSQRQTALELGISNQSVWQWENGRAIPRPAHARALEQLLSLPPHALDRPKNDEGGKSADPPPVPVEDTRQSISITAGASDA